jgi:SAM-dependent methyltransferase
MRADLNRYEDPWTAGVYDCEAADPWGDRDLDFYLELARESEGPVLELACGTGRLLLPLAQAGREITGLEISPHMLAVARRKLLEQETAARQRVMLIEGDMSGFSLGRQFGLILIPYRSFQALLEKEDQRGCLQCCREHLAGEGRLVINVFHPRLSRLVQSGWVEEQPHRFAGPDETDITVVALTKFDLSVQRLTSRVRYECASPDDRVTSREHLLEIRYFFRFEMEWMLEACGLQVEALYGDFDRSEFAADSPEMIFVARRVP